VTHAERERDDVRDLAYYEAVPYLLVVESVDRGGQWLRLRGISGIAGLLSPRRSRRSRRSRISRASGDASSDRCGIVAFPSPRRALRFAAPEYPVGRIVSLTCNCYATVSLAS